MTPLDLEAEYDNRGRVPGHPAISARWTAQSEARRAEGRAELDIAYGPHARHRYDLFQPTSGNSQGVLVYIHGGYWQRGDRRDHSWVARELNGRGITVALPSYRLCPDVSVMEIIEDARACVTAVWQKLGVPMAVAGHSAGGHLAAAMLATDWASNGLPTDVVRAAYAISGAFDPEPLLTTSIGEGARLTPDAARAANLCCWTPPRAGTRFVAAAGGDESGEFLRQSRDIVVAWSQAGVTAEAVIIPNANHFTVVDELGRADSGMTVRMAELAHWAARTP